MWVFGLKDTTCQLACNLVAGYLEGLFVVQLSTTSFLGAQ